MSQGVGMERQGRGREGGQEDGAGRGWRERSEQHLGDSPGTRLDVGQEAGRRSDLGGSH